MAVTWDIASLDATKTVGSLSDVVTTVHWTASDSETFLILLNDRDFESKCPLFPSLDHRIEYFNEFPGELKIVKFSAIENLDLKIEDTPIPKQLYILLHKEQLYIDIKNYLFYIYTFSPICYF